MKSPLMQQLELHETFFHLDRAIAFLEGRAAEAFTPRERSDERRFDHYAKEEVSLPDLPAGELRSLQRVIGAALRDWHPQAEWLEVQGEELVAAIRLLKRLILAGET